MKACDIQEQIERLIPKAETGEQWAEICRLEVEMISAAHKEIGDASELARFKEHGDRASYHYADDSAKEWGLANVEKRKALAIFDANKDLQPQMREIARGFLWGHELNKPRPSDLVAVVTPPQGK